MNKEELNDFRASNGWLESWKKTYGVWEKRSSRKADHVFSATIKAWIERLTELSQEYEPQNILNLDELGLFFKTLPEKGLAEKKSKDWKNRNNEWEPCLLWRLMVLLFLNSSLFGHQKHHGVLDLSKVRHDQRLFITFQIAKHGWIVVSWRLFLTD